jgi:surface antigen
MGGFGAGRLYLKSPWLGILKLLTFGGFGFWWLADVIRPLFGTMKDGRAESLKNSPATDHLMKMQSRTIIAFLLWLFYQTAIAANPPTTISPGSGSSPGVSASSLTPTFSWNPTSEATGYGLYIRDMTASGTPLIYPNSSGTTANPLTGTSFSMPSGYLVNGHTYRWNMTSFVGSTESSGASVVLYFQTPAAAVVASPPLTASATPPTINAPGGPSSPGTVVGSLTPTFGWKWVSGATGYGLYIRDMTAVGTPLIYPNSSGTTAIPITGFDFGSGPTFPLPPGYLVNGHNYRWNMTSFTGSTESSAASSVLYFQTPPSVVSTLTTTSPSSGISAGTVMVTPPTTISPGYASSPGMVTASLAPVFTWNAANGASGYGLYIRDMTTFGAPLVYPNSSGTTYSPLTGTFLTLPNGCLVNGHTYRWNMTSFSGSTESSTASGVLYFQTPPVASAPIVAFPSSGGSAGTVQPTQPVITTTPTVPITATPLAGQPDFSNSYYTTANIFWTSGNAPASTSPPNPPGCKLGNSLGNCTWYAYGRMLELGNNPTKMKTLHGNAEQWANEAAAAGILTNNIPEVGAIAQSVSKDHVAVVENINGGTITVSESAYIGNNPSPSSSWSFLWRSRTCPSTWFDHYIHVSKILTSSYQATTTSSPSSGGAVPGVAKSVAASAPRDSAIATTQNQPIDPSASQAVTLGKATRVVLVVQAMPNEGGAVSGGGICVSGSSHTVTAMPNNYFYFDRWTEDGNAVSSSASYNFTLNGNRRLVAHFKLKPKGGRPKF